MIKHFFTAKYRILTRYEDIYDVHKYYVVDYKPKRSFKWIPCRIREQTRFTHYDDALRLAFSTEVKRRTLTCKEFTADQILKMEKDL